MSFFERFSSLLLWREIPSSRGRIFSGGISRCKSVSAFSTSFEAAVFSEYEDKLAPYARGIEEISVSINDISLELMRIRNKTEETKGYLVPAWVFCGNSGERFTDGSYSYDNGSWRKEAPNIILAVNAADGSVIDLREGYSSQR